MDLTVQHLRYFLAVADDLHFARAAERLHISPPSLSQQINTLEKRLHIPLFHRTSRHVELTLGGTALVPLARRAVESMDAVIDWAQPALDRRDKVRIGLMAANQHTNGVLSAAVDRFPDVSWEVHSIGLADALSALREDQVDVVLSIHFETPVADGIVAVPLWTEHRVLLVHDRHPLAGRSGVLLSEIGTETFIGVRDTVGAESWFAEPNSKDFHPPIRPMAANFEEILQLCAAGVGVNIAGSGAAGAYARPGISYIPITDAADVTTYLCRKTSTTGILVREFQAIASEVAMDVRLK